MLHSGTIVMAAHARSWGAIDPALRPPLSSVPPRTMAGAFYSSPVFPKQPPARSQTTYAGQDPSHFASHRLENEDHPKDFLNRFPCIHPVMHLSVTLLKRTGTTFQTKFFTSSATFVSFLTGAIRAIVVGRTGCAKR